MSCSSTGPTPSSSGSRSSRSCSGERRHLGAPSLRRHREAGVRFVQANIDSIDPAAKRVETDAGSFDADILVVALGADLDPSATRASSKAATSSTQSTERSRCATSSRLRGRPGHRCGHLDALQVPAAPSETALLMHDFLTTRGSRQVRDRPGDAAPRPDPRHPTRRRRCSRIRGAGIGWHPTTLVRGLDPDRAGRCSARSECPMTCSSGCPSTRCRRLRGRQGHRCGPRRPLEPADLVPRCVRGRRRDECRHAEGWGVRRRSGARCR